MSEQRITPIESTQSAYADDDPWMYDEPEPETRGFSVGAVFFGWLVSVALPVFILALLSVAAAGAAATYDVTRSDLDGRGDTVALVASGLVAASTVIGFIAGGYVAGRMVLRNGARHGVGVWVLAIVATAMSGLSAYALQTRYDVDDIVNTPDMSAPFGLTDVRAIFAFAVVLLVTLLAAALGGRAGQRYHTRDSEPTH
jgi:magnesium-transporting ATPase (P-type)